MDNTVIARVTNFLQYGSYALHGGQGGLGKLSGFKAWDNSVNVFLRPFLPRDRAAFIKKESLAGVIGQFFIGGPFLVPLQKSYAEKCFDVPDF